MASVFGFIKRVVMGEPLFDNQQQPPPGNGPLPLNGMPPIPPNQPAGQMPTTGIIKGNDNTFPVVQVTRADTRFSGNNIQVYCHIRNNSRQRMLVDKINLLGNTRQITDDLQPNEEREYLIYSGPQLVNQAYHDAHLNYKTESGDYFDAYHDVTYTYHPENKTYTIDELRLHLPIRDIYG